MHSEIREGTLFISGDVTVKTLTAAVFARFEQQCRLKTCQSLDLSGVTRADSACVSLLLTARRLSKHPLRLQHLPESVQALGGLYDINDWFAS
ncbi:STAS domain-containing protein [Neisseria lisongii]|uniref:STAS domain-containing protein n=1 Tax=Neisseria lisongii TaxID=2912188 RepID=A0AAW5ALC0_9NEIS|nr:STAS domain-containing protein [Neisseria lisongii]MCF7529954.1 STAS domain-containing protein [Neisseria lisongii]